MARLGLQKRRKLLGHTYEAILAAPGLTEVDHAGVEVDLFPL